MDLKEKENNVQNAFEDACIKILGFRHPPEKITVSCERLFGYLEGRFPDVETKRVALSPLSPFWMQCEWQAEFVYVCCIFDFWSQTCVDKNHEAWKLHKRTIP